MSDTDQTIQEIHDLNIVDVINAYSSQQLQKKGATWKGLCPFHDEKTPSFTAIPSRGIFKCFGCEKGGDGISFVMDHEGMSFMEAITDIADRFKLSPPKKLSNKKKEKIEAEQKHKNSLEIVNEFAKDHFCENLKNQKPQEIKDRISPEMAKKFEIGYALNTWDTLRKKAKEKSYKENLLIDAGVLISKNSKVYDRFRGRMIFPVHNKRGKIIGFSGRDIIGDSDAKYINTPETDIFKKGKELYGLFQAKRAIAKSNNAYLVEGNTDVTTLHGIGVENTVAPLGTAFTEQQADVLKRYCNGVTIIGDGDDNGLKAIEKTGVLLIQKGFHVYVITMPQDTDPDEYFTSLEQFQDYQAKNTLDFIIWYAKRLAGNHEPKEKVNAIEKTCQLLMHLGQTQADVYIDALAKHIKPKKQWQRHIESLRADDKAESAEKDNLPENVDPYEVEKYGFYEYKNRYYFRSKEGGYYPISNFVLKPLFHIKLINNSTRLFEMTNVFGHKEIVEIDMDSMVSLQNFRKIVESPGNFLFEGNDIQFMRLKRKLYDNTKTCELIENLGWQRAGFFAFSNKIFAKQVKELDNTGIVEHEGKYYFIPALSDIYKYDKTIYLAERRFQLVERDDVNLEWWSQQFIKVFGDNGKIAICFFIATLFKDFISDKFKFFPILNAFGPSDTGKSQMAWSLMYLFGEAQPPYNLHNGTKVGLSEHMAEFSNAFAWIDEYKNATDYDKIEMLKSAWDLVGRKKGGIEKGKKTKTSVINAGILLTGQEMPTADIALLKRVILLQFSQNEFTEQEQKNFNELKESEKTGLSHLTLPFLKYRDQFEKEYFQIYDRVSSELNKDLQGTEVEDRIFRNMVVIISAFRFFEDKLNLNMSYNEMRKLARQNIIDQSSFILNSQEIRGFWDTIESAVENAHLSEKTDFIIDRVYEIKLNNNIKRFEVSKKVIYLKFSRIYEVYAETMRRTGQHALPKATLLFYLKTSKEFIGMKKQTRFENHITNSYVFDYEKLNLSLERGVEPEDDKTNKEENENDEMPF
ncbi:MAG: DNA primase [Bacteroidales bacterium]|nr:DNA primase [Bacteroidales bacterium]